MSPDLSSAHPLIFSSTCLLHPLIVSSAYLLLSELTWHTRALPDYLHALTLACGVVNYVGELAWHWGRHVVHCCAVWCGSEGCLAEWLDSTHDWGEAQGFFGGEVYVLDGGC